MTSEFKSTFSTIILAILMTACSNTDQDTINALKADVTRIQKESAVTSDLLLKQQGTIDYLLEVRTKQAKTIEFLMEPSPYLPKEVLIEKSELQIWQCDSDLNYVVKKHLNKASLKDLLGELNKTSELKVILRTIQENVAFVMVNDDELLTQRMGTTGARCFLGSVYYSMTSSPRINDVKFLFNAGDHADSNE